MDLTCRCKTNYTCVACKRFWEKVQKTETCWLWASNVNGSGYGHFWNGNRLVVAHRWAYEHLIGPIPEGLQLDHLCRVRRCVNPSHLEPVTRGENIRRGDHQGRRKTHCPQGHIYDETNTRVYAGKRSCRMCNNVRRRVGAKER